MDGEEMGKLVQQRRESLSLKQEDLAEMAGVTTKTVYLVESGKGNPSLGTLLKLLTVLGLEFSAGIKKTAE